MHEIEAMSQSDLETVSEESQHEHGEAPEPAQYPLPSEKIERQDTSILAIPLTAS